MYFITDHNKNLKKREHEIPNYSVDTFKSGISILLQISTEILLAQQFKTEDKIQDLFLFDHVKLS